MRSILSARFYNRLWLQSAERDKHEGLFDDDGVNVPAWVEHERAVMLTEVNEERKRRGLPLVDAKHIKAGEQPGDPQYGERLAEHCAWLAVEPRKIEGK